LPHAETPETLDEIVTAVRACRLCIEAPARLPLPHQPRPVLRASATARIAIAGQAPGKRVHESGIPFTDPSGDRLRHWMGVTLEEFYDAGRVAIIPMGFCFPGVDARGADLPPRRECAPLWRERLFSMLPGLELILLVGGHAHRWHLPPSETARVTDTVGRFREILGLEGMPRRLVLPHPSWRNNHWIAANPWFEAEVLPCLRREVRRLLD
jgi:uracil-DNA glycosylase